MNIHDDKQQNPILRLLNLVDTFHTELDKKLLLALNNILQEILRNPQTTYSVNDIEKIIQAVEYSIKRTTSQNYQQFPKLLQQNSILKGKLTTEIEVDINALQEALINTQQLLDQRELEISRLSTTVEGLNERLYEALEELNEEQKYMQALEQEVTALKTQISQILSESGQIQESTLQSLLTTLEATDSQEIRNRTKLERVTQDKEQLASDVKSLDRALQTLKLQYYQALEKIDTQNQEIEEVLQENSQFRDMLTEWGKKELPATPLVDSRESPLVSIEIPSSNASAIQRTRSVTNTVIKTRDDNILS
ncbi:MAG: hypothetical protein ACFFCQ_13390 [Promethearchaeota archaeon]